jgi:mRNA-degrading endonuclease RelE of RelBE toxin-antitoxin system
MLLPEEPSTGTNTKSRVPWIVSLAKQAARDLDRLPAADWPRVRRAIDDIAIDPHQGDVRPLQGTQWKGHYRKRAGDFRVIFTLDRAARVVTIRAILRRPEKTYR